jgi:hypothetical protein
MAGRSRAARSRTTHTSSSWLEGVLEQEEVQVDDGNFQLPTPRETPQPEDNIVAPPISSTLFDVLDVPADSGYGTVHRTRTAKSGNPLMTIVDCQGVFEMEVLFCGCRSSVMSQYEQLLRAGLFPATFKQIETLFTFSVLDNFLTDNLECKTAAQQYYSKLQSITSIMFPDHVPVSQIVAMIFLAELLS